MWQIYLYAPGCAAVNVTVVWAWGWTTSSIPNSSILKPWGSSNLLMRVSSTSSPWCTIRLEGNQILDPSRATLINVNFLGSAAAASPAPSIRPSRSTTSQLRCRLPPYVSRTVTSPLLLHVLDPVVPLPLKREAFSREEVCQQQALQARAAIGRGKPNTEKARFHRI